MQAALGNGVRAEWTHRLKLSVGQGEDERHHRCRALADILQLPLCRPFVRPVVIFSVSCLAFQLRVRTEDLGG